MNVAENENASTESFANYLSRNYVLQKGYHPGAVPEARALLDAADIVLTRADGMSFQIVCLVDREANPQSRFLLEKDALLGIGAACSKYVGTVNGTKLPVSIRVIEIANEAPAEEDIARLKLLRSGPKPFSKAPRVAISSWLLNTAENSIWTNVPFKGIFAGRHELQKLMKEPRKSVIEPPEDPALSDEPRRPVLTHGLLGVIAAIFACELLFPVEPAAGFLDPGVHTLAALGALDRNSVFEQGEWWRLFSAPFLHGGFLHVLFNGFALFLAGMILERVIGHAWFAAIFAVSAVCGSLISLSINPANVVSVGASGAIMGLFAATLVAAHRFPACLLYTSPSPRD